MEKLIAENDKSVCGSQSLIFFKYNFESRNVVGVFHHPPERCLNGTLGKKKPRNRKPAQLYDSSYHHFMAAEWFWNQGLLFNRHLRVHVRLHAQQR